MPETSEKVLWQGMGFVFLGPGFNPCQRFVQCLIFLTNLTKLLGRNLGKENSSPFQTSVAGGTSRLYPGVCSFC